jgi:subtilisin family serine protease
VALAAVASGPCRPGPAPIDRHVVQLAESDSPGLSARVEALGGRILRLHPQIGVAVVGGLDDGAAAALAGDESVVALQRDARALMIPRLDAVAWSVVDAPAAAPAGDDPASAFFFADQWDMRQIGADAAFAAGFRGDPAVRVAILDSGLDPDHMDLRGLIDEEASVAFTPSQTGPPDWADDNFHGTHVGGTVVTNGIGTSGVAPDTTLVAVKVCSASGGCAFGDVIAGILHAADVDVDVINMSFSGAFSKAEFGFFAGVLTRAVNYANRKGVLVVGSAGNAATDLQHDQNQFRWPCEASTVTCIAATGPTDERAGYSNFGTNAISVAAPGGQFDGDRFASLVLSPCSSRSLILPQCSGGDLYLFLQGTSMAAPHVAGAAALLDGQHGGGLDAAHLRTRLGQTAEDLGPPGADPLYGKGRIDVCRLLGCR